MFLQSEDDEFEEQTAGQTDISETTMVIDFGEEEVAGSLVAKAVVPQPDRHLPRALLRPFLGGVQGEVAVDEESRGLAFAVEVVAKCDFFICISLPRGVP